MYKLKCEIYPYAAKYLAPRYHISAHYFNKIRFKKIEEFGGRYCEACNQLVEKVELHESFTIENNCYYFEGFFMLCVPCHDALHYEKLGTNIDNLKRFENYWNYEEDRFLSRMSKYSIYSTPLEFMNHKKIVSENTFNFMMSDDITANYDKVVEYGLSVYNISQSFLENYNHYDCRLRYMRQLVWYVISNNIFSNYNLKECIIKDNYQIKILEEYIKNKIFFLENNKLEFELLFSRTIPKNILIVEREALIKAYSIIMKDDFIFSKKNKKTKRRIDDPIFNGDIKIFEAYKYFLKAREEKAYLHDIELEKIRLKNAVVKYEIKLMEIENEKKRNQLSAEYKKLYDSGKIGKELYERLLKFKRN